jgi:chemotaxis protein MotB
MTETTKTRQQPATWNAPLVAAILFALLAALGWYLYFQQGSDDQSRITMLEAVNVELEQVKLSLEAELERERNNRQQSQQTLEAEREEQQQIAERLEQEVARLADSNSTLEAALQSGLARQKSLDAQIAAVSGEVESRQAQLAGAQGDIEKLNRELDQARLEQGELKASYAELDRKHAAEAEHFDALRQRLEQDLNESRVQIRQLKNRMTVIDLTSEVLFASGSARIKPAGQKVLDLIAESLNNYPERAISIEGHTDNVPIGRNLPFVSNWDLSAARAMAAVDYLQQKAAVAPERLRVVGHGEYQPVASNETAEGRQRNRRIEIRLLPGSDHSS